MRLTKETMRRVTNASAPPAASERKIPSAQRGVDLAAVDELAADGVGGLDRSGGESAGGDGRAAVAAPDSEQRRLLRLGTFPRPPRVAPASRIGRSRGSSESVGAGRLPELCH